MQKKGLKVRQASRAGTIPAAPSLNNSSPQSATNDSTDKEPKRTLEVDFRELEDGTLLEMIEDPHDAT